MTRPPCPAADPAARIPAVDALRGVAVALMVQQHLGVWLWSESMMPVWPHFLKHPFMVALNMLGLLAAPLFVTLAGFGAEMAREKYLPPGATLVRRGVLIVLAGYLLNLVTPHWFTPASWYVLHLIGFCLVVSPLLFRLPAAGLALLYPLVIVLAPAAQTLLATPLILFDPRMGSATLPGGIARLAFVEGHFPVLPWLAMFVSGMLSARFRKRGRLLPITLAGIACLAAGVIPGALYNHGYAFAARGLLFRLFVAVPYVYPPFPPVILTLNGIALLLLAGALSAGEKGGSAWGFLVSPGRASLSILFAHIVLFNELARLAGIHRNLSAVPTLAVIALSIAVFAFVAARWERYDFRYGMEWLVRRWG